MKQLKSLNQNEQQMVHRLDLIQFQFEEIQKAELKLHEDEQFTEEKKKINNFEKIHRALTNELQCSKRRATCIGLVVSCDE